MTLWAWVAEFPAQPVAIPATAATEQGDKGALSQLSQLSQPFGAAGAHGSDDDREAFEERAAIMEFDGGLTRAEAEQAAAACSIRVDIAPAEPVRWHFEEWGDLRPCLMCRNLSPGGRCLSAWRGELRAAHDYSPTFPDLPQRCIGYRPTADDPDQSIGRDRWPELVEWQARQATEGP